jgi:tetratricopeptide (TPR) repeat protein
MEANQDQSGNSAGGSQLKAMKIVLIIILIMLPVVYIFYKTSGNAASPEEQPAAVKPAPVDFSALENAAETNPSYDNLVNLANAYINNNMPVKGIDPLNKAIAINPNKAIAYSNLGVAYTMLQQYRKGIEACSKALAIDSTFQLAKNNMKWAMDEQKKLKDAAEAMGKTPENKRDVAFYLDYGMDYYKLEDYDKCIEIWNKIFDKDPKNAAGMNNIGTAFMMKYQYDDAIACFKKAIQFNPNDQLGKNNLKWAMDEKSKSDQKK